MKRRSLKELDRLIGPHRVAKARATARRKMRAMFLREIRKERGVTQVRLAKVMGVSQSALSQVESQQDMQLSTLRRLIHALGGELDIVARFGDQSIVLVDSRRPRKRAG